MQCNIDARGKAVRLGLGIAGVILALSIAIAAMLDALPRDAGFAIAAGLAVVGAFGIFEGWAGWCVIRALGGKTPL